jgi:hypothetical protein
MATHSHTPNTDDSSMRMTDTAGHMTETSPQRWRGDNVCQDEVIDSCWYRGTQHSTIEIYRRRQFDRRLIAWGIVSCTYPTRGYACCKILYLVYTRCVCTCSGVWRFFEIWGWLPLAEITYLKNRNLLNFLLFQYFKICLAQNIKLLHLKHSFRRPWSNHGLIQGRVAAGRQPPNWNLIITDLVGKVLNV